ncbi:MAG: TrgA family protein [Paracoccaceae bacterium]
MPTAARLFAAIGFALVAFFASESFIFVLPEGTNPGPFSEINAALGALAGWRVMGRLAGKGNVAAVTTGFRTTVTMVVFALVLHSLYEMIRLSMKLRYDGPGEAITEFFQMLMDYGLMIVTSVPVVLILLIGGTLAAWLTEWAARRWN